MQIPQLKFAEEHIEPILAGSKTMTIRRDIEFEDSQIGRRIHLCDENGERFATAIIDDRGYTTVNMAAQMRFDGHRNYRSADELLDELHGYYPDEELDEQSTVELIYWDWEELWE